jgi:PAS domain S-box-containing protein
LALLGPTRKYREFFELSLELLCVADSEGYFRLLNPRWSEVLGYSLEELYSRPFSQFVHPDDREATEAEVARLLTEDTTLVSFTNRYRHKNGGYRHLEWHTRCVGNIFYAAARDTTEERRRKTELNRVTEELQSFAYVASHDLKAPLRGIQNLTSWVIEDSAEQLSEPSLRHLQQARQRVERMEALLDALLLYSRAGRRTEPETFHLKELLEEIAAMHRHVRPRTSVDIPSDLPTLWAPRLPLQQILQNLISNAIKHHPGPDIQVTIECREKPKHFEISVIDDGEGIPPEHYERIFGIFSTLKPRDEVEGSGIGLALVEKILNHHGGKIEVSPQASQGTRFTVYWPKEVEYETD